MAFSSHGFSWWDLQVGRASPAWFSAVLVILQVPQREVQRPLVLAQVEQVRLMGRHQQRHRAQLLDVDLLVGRGVDGADRRRGLSTFWSRVVVLPPPVVLVAPASVTAISSTSTSLPGMTNPATPDATLGVWIVTALIPVGTRAARPRPAPWPTACRRAPARP